MEVLENILQTRYELSEGKTAWRSPSNIALIKYWGKYDQQMPANPSLSFTLENACSETGVHYSASKKPGEISIDFKFDGKENQAFKERLLKYLNSIAGYFPFLNELHLDISSENTFPHSSGIASSASAMSALVLNILSIRDQLTEEKLSEEQFKQAASYFSRLASGSAARSVYGGFTVWGESIFYPKSSDLYAIDINEEEIAPVFRSLHDDILIVEKGAKKVSSSAGHSLMKNHPFASSRFELARNRMGELKRILRSGDLEKFGELIESEALTLHAMMLTSIPSFILFRPNTLSIIERIRDLRREKGLQIYFTLDAGANIHLIYPDEIETIVSTTIKDEFLAYCENGTYLCDRIGAGPINLSE